MSLVWSPDYAPVDGDFADVSLLLLGEGTNGSTTILDSSSNNLSVTAVDNAQISTAVNTPFGTGDGVLAFDGVNGNLTVPYSATFPFDNGDFTVEGWFYFANVNTNSKGLVALGDGANGAGAGAITNSWSLRYLGSEGSNQLAFYRYDGTTEFLYQTTGVSVTANSWHHIAVCRASGTLRIFFNGASYYSASNSLNFSALSTNEPLRVALQYYGPQPGFTGPRYWNGYLSNLRITKGVARYTENFDVPTAPFPILSPSGRITIADDSLDADARQYIINVEEQDGQALEPAVRTAINDFVVGCKSDGIWNAIKASCLLCAARSLEGALVPLKGSAPTNFNFTLSDYDRELGLLGNGSTKYLDSNRAANTELQNNVHLAAFKTQGASNGTFVGAINLQSGNDTSIDYFQGFRFAARSSYQTLSASNTYTGFIGVSRSSVSQFTARINGGNGLVNLNSNGNTTTTNFFVFNRSGSNYLSQDRLAFYSIGEALNLALLDTRISAFITAIGAAIL